MTNSENAGRAGASPAPRTTMPGQGLLNRLVHGLLRTPGLSRIVGGRLVVLYVVGRKSGRRYAVPVAYLADGNDLLIGTSSRWAGNLRSGQSIEIRFKGKRRRADVHLYTSEPDVVSAYGRMARVNPTFASFNSIHVSADGEPDPGDLRLVWRRGARVLMLTPR